MNSDFYDKESITASFDELKKLYQCLKGITGVARGFKKLEGIDQNIEFSLGYLKENVGLLAEGDWQDIIVGLDPEDIIMFESLIKSLIIKIFKINFFFKLYSRITRIM